MKKLVLPTLFLLVVAAALGQFMVSVDSDYVIKPRQLLESNILAGTGGITVSTTANHRVVISHTPPSDANYTNMTVWGWLKGEGVMTNVGDVYLGSNGANYTVFIDAASQEVTIRDTLYTYGSILDYGGLTVEGSIYGNGVGVTNLGGFFFDVFGYENNVDNFWGGLASGFVGDLGWSLSGPTCAHVGTNGHSGIIRFTRSSASLGAAWQGTALSVSDQLDKNLWKLHLEFQARDTNCIYRLGFGENSVVSDPPGDGIWMSASNVASAHGNWFLVTRSASTETYRDTLVPSTTDFITAVLENDGQTNIYLTINGQRVATNTMVENVPNIGLRPMLHIRPTEAQVKELDMDKWYWSIKQ